MDDVTLTDDTEEFGTLAIEGPKTAELVRELTAVDFAALADGTSLDVAVRNPERGRSAISCRMVRRGLPSSINVESGANATNRSTEINSKVAASGTKIVSAEFIAARKDLTALWKILCDAAKSVDGGPIGYSALSAIRLAQGVPWFGYDFGEKQIPHEAGLQDSHISYTKGCYTGQEIVERVRSRGQVNRRRVGLRFADDAKNVPAADTPLLLDGAEIGFVTRAAQSFYPVAIFAMGYVRKEGSALGTVLDCGGEKAAVVNLPLSAESVPQG